MLGYPLGHSGLLPAESQGGHNKLGLNYLILGWGIGHLIGGWSLRYTITLGWSLGNTITLGWSLGYTITLRWSLRNTIIIGRILRGLWYAITWWILRCLLLLIAWRSLRSLWYLRYNIIVYRVLRCSLV